MHDANSKGSALNEATHCLSPALPLLVRKQADWPRPSKGCPGIQNCRPHLAYRQKQTKTIIDKTEKGEETPIESEDDVIR